MEILVETFECDEVIGEGHPEVNEESLRLIEELGLEGQKPVDVGGGKMRVPYMKMTKEQLLVYRALCPESYPPKNYSRSPIPLRVLQVIAHAQPLFTKLEIWDVEDSTIKDPVLVGYDQSGEYGDKAFYLLARWGAELDDFFSLRKRAIQALRDRAASDLKKIEVRVRGLLNSIDVMDLEDFPWGWSNEPARYEMSEGR